MSKKGIHTRELWLAGLATAFLLGLMLILMPVRSQAASGSDLFNLYTTDVEGTGGAAFTLHWDAVKGADRYEVWYRKLGNDWWYITYTTSTEKSFNSSFGNTYEYKVEADKKTTDDNGNTSYTIFATSDTLTVMKVWDAPTISSINSTSMTSIKITWKSLSDYTYCYHVYRSDAAKGAYTLVGTVYWDYNSSTVSFEDTGLTTGKTWYYQVCACNLSADNPDGNMSKTVSCVAGPSVPSVKAGGGGKDRIVLTWDKVSTATGYQILRSDSKSGTYKAIKYVKNNATVSYTNKGLTSGKTYYYKMRSYYVRKDGSKLWSGYSSVVSAKAFCGAVAFTSIKPVSGTKATLTWNVSKDADGYAIYCSKSKTTGYKRVKTIKNPKTTSYTLGGLKNTQKYYFKIRAYRKVNGVTGYGDYSAVKSRLMNYFCYQGETYQQRCQRIWGTDYYSAYSSAKEAAKHMTTIKIKAWDINSKGKKYTRTFYLDVNKKIAATVKQIFKEIYEGDEKFPIHDVGCYSWRGDNSSSEHCDGLAIDINPDENAMMYTDTGEILSGSFYKPGKNPYSIPAGGDVVTIMEKYGFSWGDWGTKVDYMHFSYFGG